jgi:adenine-specific DNA-methyltransferase
MTELIWDGKYKDGKKGAPVRIALPFQKIETVNESTQDRQTALDMYAQGRPAEWRNRLIWGDKKYVLPSILEEFRGEVNLIYIDPPFFTGTDQIYTISISESEEFITKEPSMIEEAAYRNVWRQGSDSFCAWISDTLYFLRELLTEDGAIYIRFDQYWSHYVKIIADEVFGKDNFQNEIVVKRIYKNFTNQGKKSLQLATDSLLLYFKTPQAQFNNIEIYLDEEREGYWRRIDDSSGIRKPPERKILGKTYFPPAGKHFKFGQDKVDEMAKQGKIRINDRGRPEYWVEPTDKKPLTSNWTDISSYSFTTGYPTENSEQLLERVIRANSKVNDLILDCFCGSGTTAAVAERLGRRWITCDIGRFSIHTTRKRLLQIPNLKPFMIQNLGKYERQVWQSAEFAHPEDRATQEKAYRKFILALYHADSVKGYNWLHGTKSKRMVHVGAIDSPVSLGDVKSIIQEFWKSVGKSKDISINGVDVLGWEFAFDINETAKQQAASNNVDMKFKKIPRDAMDKHAVEQGDIHFFELAGLDVKAKVKKQKVELMLKDFVIPPDDVPEEVQKSIMHWSQWIDYWAVDWNYKEDTFHNEWQSYRTKKEPNIVLETSHLYETAGKYTIIIKVIDILGNDTTKSLNVETE